MTDSMVQNADDQESAHQGISDKETTDLQYKGKTTALLFGRFQPLHKGHYALIKYMLDSGLDVHIFLNAKVDTPDERNPYNSKQKQEMFSLVFPEIPPDHIHHVNVYLGGGGDIGNSVKSLLNSFKEVAPLDKCVIFYGRKPEDVKSYLVDGQLHKDVHYMDLLIPNTGLISHEVAPFASYGEVINASDFRGDKANREILPDRVGVFVATQEILAERNKRTVGANTNKDALRVDASIPPPEDPDLGKGDFQMELLRLARKFHEGLVVRVHTVQLGKMCPTKQLFFDKLPRDEESPGRK